MSDKKSTSRALALFMGLVVLFSMFAIPSAFGEEGSAPVGDDGEVVEPAAEEPVAEEPAVEEPAVEEPAVEEPAVEEPAAEEPAAEEPAEETAEEPSDGVSIEEPVVVDAPEVAAPERDASGADGDSAAKAAPQKQDGNNGTVKVDGVDFDDHQNNEPHVGCVFEIDYYGFDQGDSAQYTFELQPPTGNQTLITDTVFMGAPGVNKLNASTGPIDLTAAIVASGEGPHPNQGYHVKLSSVTPDGKKFKVFWVEGCQLPPPDCPNGYTLTTSVTPPAGGSISGASANPHAQGSSDQLTANANQGYTFDHWSGDGTGDDPRTMSYDGFECDLEVEAVFTEDSVQDCPNGYTLTTKSEPALVGQGAITGKGANPHADGSSVGLKASPPAGWEFDGWSGDGFGNATRTVTFGGTDCNREVTAEFTEVLPLPPFGPNDPNDPNDPAKRAPTVSNRLPFTGSELVTYLWLAMLLMTGGVGAYMAARRRMEETEETIE
jgi:hypothetical protein